MNLNLVDLSKSIKADYKGRFYNTIDSTFNCDGETNINDKMLDKENKNMTNAEFIDRLKSILDSKEIDIIGDLARDTGITVDKVQTIISSLINLPIQFNKKGENGMRESFQIGDKIEINASGDGPNNYAGMLNSFGITRELKARISDLQKLLKEKDALIAAQRETIEVLRENKRQG